MDTLQRRGICVTCKHWETCIFKENSDQCVLTCEEFEEVWQCNTSRTAVSIQLKRGTYNAEAPAGLCKTCDNFFNCSFTKPESGIWSCGEYK